VSLAVKVGADKPVYKPGEQATVSVTTTGEDGPVAAAVGLFGVDETLGLLAPLLPPSAYDRLSPAPVMREPAFGVLDAMALSLGRVRGEHAAAATVLFVQSVPQPSSLDTTTAGSGASVFEPTLPLADRFYGVLEALHGEVRRFEETAPKEQKLTPKRMLELWDEAIAKAKAKGVVTTDVFGRPLRLQGLPDQLVAMCDPHVVVRDGARLNEDIEAWIPLVRSTR
jgi:hypothetical protein